MGNNGNCKNGSDDTVVEYKTSMFSRSRVIGKGGFGKVFKVTQKKTKNVYALKVISKARVLTKKSVPSVMNERQILSKLLEEQCEFIVNMRCSFQDRDNLYLLMDLLDGGDLRYYINRSYVFNEEQIRFLVRCLMEGLNHLHQRNIIHRDIKPENIILDKAGYARITDLGIARYWKTQNSHQTSGTPGYMAPEVLMRKNHSFCADLYAVGVIAYELVVGKRPYMGRDRKSIRDEMYVKQAKIPLIYTSKISKQGVDFINKLLERDSKKRLGHNGMSEVLMHPWLSLRYEDRIRFLQKRIISPIVPLDIVPNQGLQEDTEPDPIELENRLLLKRPEVQQLFENYDWSPNSLRSRTGKFESVCTTSSTISTSFDNKFSRK